MWTAWSERRTEIINDLKIGKDLLREDKAQEALAAFVRALVEITHAGNALDSPWTAWSPSSPSPPPQPGPPSRA